MRGLRRVVSCGVAALVGLSSAGVRGGGLLDRVRQRLEQSKPQRDEAARRAGDGLRQAGDNLRKGWEQTRPQREEAGRRIGEGLREAGDNLRKGWEQTRPQREEAGRRIGEGLREAGDNLRKGWEQTRPQRDQVAEQIQERLRASVDALRRGWEETRGKREALADGLRAKWEAWRPQGEAYLRELSDRAARVVREHGAVAQQALERAAREYGPRVVDALSRAYEAHGRPLGEAMARVFEQAAPEISAAVRDPHDAQKVMCAALAVVRMKQQWDSEKKALTYRALRAVGDLPVKGAQGDTTLAEMSRSWLRQTVPSLQGSSVVEDPAEFVAYGLIHRDTDYLFNEMKIVDSRRGGGKVSLRNALVEASPVDPETALDVLGVMADLEGLSSSVSAGERVEASADLFARSVNLYQRRMGASNGR